MAEDVSAAAVGLTGDRLEALRTLCAVLNAPRVALRRFFDGWVRDQRDPALPVNFLHAIARARHHATGFDPVKDVDALALAVSALGPPQTAFAWMTAAISHGLFDTALPGTDPRTARAQLTDLVRYHLGTGMDFGIAKFHRGSFQLANSPNQTWSDPGHVAPAMMLARRRLCRIVVRDEDENSITGTGFLVGPSVVLTNHHVVDALIPPNLSGTAAVPPLDDTTRIRLEFDYSSTTGLKDSAASIFGPKLDWCVARSPKGKLEPAGAAPFWWTDAQARNAWLETVVTDLDYALIRLEGAPGLRRGWYNLEELAAAKSRDGCWVMHHPNSLDQTITEGHLHYFNAAKPRIFHTASTVTGSSGGLLLNNRGAAMALHHAGLGIDVFAERAAGEPDPVPGKTFINLAIPLARIYEDLKLRGATAELREAVSIAPYRGTLGDNVPVFGREGFFRDLEALHRGEKRIMMVHVAPEFAGIGQPGKTFSGDIIRSIFSGDDYHHVTLGPKERKVDARPMAEEMLRQLDPDRIAQLATTSDTTGPAFVKALSAVIEATLRGPRYGNRMVWIVLDDLERAHVADGSGRELLATLYASSQTLANLRIVLIGLPPDIQIGGIPTDAVVRSVIGAKDIGDLKDLFRNWIALQGERDKQIDPGALDILGSALASYASTGAPLSLLSEFVTDHLAAAVAAYLAGESPP